jgi:hypothetical protein
VTQTFSIRSYDRSFYEVFCGPLKNKKGRYAPVIGPETKKGALRPFVGISYRDAVQVLRIIEVRR